MSTFDAGVPPPDPTPGLLAGATLGARPAAPADDRLRTAGRVFTGTLAGTVALTLLWLYAVTTHRGSAFFPRYKIDGQALGSIIGFILTFWLLWGWLWYLAKRGILRRWVGFSPDELRRTFSSRMKEPFEVGELVARHSERRIRIADMIGRRGRFMLLGMTGFIAVYVRLRTNPEPAFLTLGLQDGLFEAVVFNWFALALYRSEGWLARMFYGAQSRVMDGQLARANCLLITTLWSYFRLIMVPIGIALAGRFPPATFAAVYLMIWGSYLASDAFAEIVGSLFGAQKLQVRGLGDVNRKSIAGLWGCFVASLVLCGGLVLANHLPPIWLVLALVISVSNALLELISPRGTDDITMATANALLCWGFGLLAY